MFNKGIFCLSILMGVTFLYASQNDQYTANPQVISVAAMPAGFGDHFMAADVNGDGAVDYLFRSLSTIYAYDHDGGVIWSESISLPGQVKNASYWSVNGSTFAVGDVDLDGTAEVLVINDNDQVLILSGATGDLERTLNVPVNSYQEATYLQIVNLRGLGDVDLIVQTTDETAETEGIEYYINRSLIAFQLDTETEIWRKDQNRSGSSGASWYENYWGQAHGAFFAADIDGDGMDEVVGGSWIDHDGTVKSSGFPDAWVGTGGTFIDHLDALAIGDFRPDLPGLEWMVAQEDHIDKVEWHTALLTASSMPWRKETPLFADGNNDREAQNLAVGNFSTAESGVEVWNRSRFGALDAHAEGRGQHPWIFNVSGTQIGHYAQSTQLPDAFNMTVGSDTDDEYGIEMIWTIDWDGSGQHCIAAESRGVGAGGNVGVFNALTGDTIWTTMGRLPQVHARSLYVADVAGDSREELIVMDQNDSSIKIYHNEDVFSDTQPNKWDDPLYRRLKQNWSYYSPGSYAGAQPVQLAVRVFLQGPYDSATHLMRTDLKDNGVLPAASPYAEAPLILEDAEVIPEDAVDWVLVELRLLANGPAVYRRSAFLRNDGQIIDEKGNAYINAFAESAASYYIVIKHRNHLAVMSNAAQDFSSGSANYDFTSDKQSFYGNDAALVESGVYGMFAGDADGNNVIVFASEVSVLRSENLSAGYYNSDLNLDGAVVFASELYFVRENNLHGSNII